MKVLIADKMQESGVEALKAAGLQVESNPDLTADNLAEAVAHHDPDALVVRSTKVNRAVFEAGGRLSLVVRAGAGYDTIDTDAASELAVFVANCPGKNALAVAELTMGLLMCCDRRLPDAAADLRAGVWKKKDYSKARGLAGRTLGVLGLGNIGLAVIERAKAFEMNVVAWSRSLTPARAKALGIGFAATPLDVAREADAVTLHFAAAPETKGMIGAEFFDAMKPGAYFLNTTRGSTVDYAALKKAIQEKGIRAGLDVYDVEPASDGPFENDIVKLPGVYGAHHVGASTDQAQDAIAEEAVRVILRYAETGEVDNCVNRCAKSPAQALLVVRHQNKPGVLAKVFDAISQAGGNVEEMENLVYDGAKACCARVRLDSELPAEALAQIRADPRVVSVSQATA